ncbi:MAG: cell division protease FtsH [Alphaproteobacteria bacterium]|jgi:cell division protease FtsH
MAKNLILWLVIAVVLMSVFQSFEPSDKGANQITYDVFIKDVRSSNVSEVLIQRDGTIQYKSKTGKMYSTTLPSGSIFGDQNLTNDLIQYNVKILPTPPVEQPSFIGQLVISILPMLLILVVIMFVMKKMQGGGKGGGAMSFGKSKAKLLGEGDIKTRFSDVAGCEEAIEDVADIIDFLRNPEKYWALNAEITRGLLMVGKPGTGKTLLARAMAGESKLPFFTISGSEFVEMFVGVGASRVRDLFEQARSRPEGAIIFIDEIDAVGKKRGGKGGGGNDEREQTLNQILVEMDGFDEQSNVIVIAATNRPEILDSALKRPGRFTREVVVGVPDVGGREKILLVHSKDTPLADDVNFSDIAKSSSGMSGAQLKDLINVAALAAAKKGQKTVEQADLLAAIEKVVIGTERKSAIISPELKENIAMHEGAHLLAGYIGYVLGAHPEPYMVSIMPRGEALGVCMYRENGDETTWRKDQIMARILSVTAGRIGEWIHHDKNELKISTGASNDLEAATRYVNHMIREVGLSREFGLLNIKSNEYGQMNVGAKRIDMADDIADKWLKAADVIVRKLISKHEAELQAIKARLVEKETIREDDIEELLGHLAKEYKDVKFEDLFDIEAKAAELAQVNKQGLQALQPVTA